MKTITVVLTAEDQPDVTAQRLARSGLVAAAILCVPPGGATGRTELGGLPCTEVEGAAPGSGAVVQRVLQAAGTAQLLRVTGDTDPHPTALRRMAVALSETGAGMVFGDYMDLSPEGKASSHPLSDYQTGSLQDSFPFGPLQLWSVQAIRDALQSHGGVEGLSWMAWYDVRLKVSVGRAIHRLPEPLALLIPRDQRRSGEQVFDYLTASRERQVEAEQVCTAHLERVGAKLTGPFRAYVPQGEHPVDVSVVIPVRDRARTVMDAVSSALDQQVDASFNVIVVDNHSTDGTTELLRERAQIDPRLVHVIPDRLDLGIGGCWNQAVNHPSCGRYVVQLDSDDIYSGKDTVARMFASLRDGQCGMAVGSYTLVNMELQELPPGLIDHREWTDDNGPNNALRIGGLGAPRAFATDLLRRYPFPNASYGEDYAVVLRISREYRVGRIYDSLYLCRRWEDNSDADLPPATKARYQTYKDRLRTLELAARQQRGS
ncbi:MAG: glycosyltransferase family 2 protein [Myxococcales bacterium]|nr:glycosyltransferase family 2 protein [Myxococcales bacterium]